MLPNDNRKVAYECQGQMREVQAGDGIYQAAIRDAGMALTQAWTSGRFASTWPRQMCLSTAV